MTENSYFLTTARISFRRWSADDFDAANELWGDLEVTKFIGGPWDRAKISARLQKEIDTQLSHGVQYWPIFERGTDAHIGCCGLRPYAKLPATLELGFHLRPTFWGRGFAREAASAVIAYAFDQIGVDALFAGHNPKNEASAILLKKLGFAYTHAEFYEPTGLHHPSYLRRRI